MYSPSPASQHVHPDSYSDLDRAPLPCGLRKGNEMSWAITYSKDAQSQMIYTFGIGPDQHLHAKFWNWVKTIALWADLGAPSGTQAALGAGLTATTYYETGNPGKQRIHVFVIGDDQHLHVDSWNGSNWMWHDQGM